MADRTRRGRGDGTVHQRAATMDTNTEGDGVTLTEFLLARIAEDDYDARDGGIGPVSSGCWSTGRVMAECKAKRRIVERRAPIDIPATADCPPGQGFVWLDGAHTAVAAERERILRLLALPYADHPDYDESWRV